MTMNTHNRGSKYDVKRSMIKVTGNENVKNRFSRIFSIYTSSTPKLSPALYVHIWKTSRHEKIKYIIYYFIYF